MLRKIVINYNYNNNNKRIRKKMKIYRSKLYNKN